MGILQRSADLVYTIRFLKLLVTPFEKTDAFKLKIIDKSGVRNKATKLDSPEKKSAYTPFHRLVYNIRRLMSKVPGGSSRIANYAAGLYLIHEKYGIDIDKALKASELDQSELIDESVNWFVLQNGELAPGTYRIKHEKMLNVNYDMLVKSNDKVRIEENCSPIGQVGHIDIYEAIHVNTNQTIYITAPELIK